MCFEWGSSCRRSEIVAQSGLSRASVREALKYLADAGVIESRTGDGTYIKSRQIPSELIAERWEMRHGQVNDVLEAWRTIESRVAQLASIKATEADYIIMNEIAERAAACPTTRQSSSGDDSRNIYYVLLTGTAL